MTFGEAIMQALSFFWSPAWVAVLLVVLAFMSFVATVAWIPDYPYAATLAAVVFLGAGILAVALGIYMTANGIGTLSWEVAGDEV